MCLLLGKVKKVHFLRKKAKINLKGWNKVERFPFYMSLNSNEEKMVYYILYQFQKIDEGDVVEFDNSVFSHTNSEGKKSTILPRAFRETRLLSTVLFRLQKLFSYIDIYEKDEDGICLLDEMICHDQDRLI